MRVYDMRTGGPIRKGDLFQMGEYGWEFGKDQTERINKTTIIKTMYLYKGEKRAPKRGEFYISGNPACAWNAPNNLTQVHAIGERIRVRVERIETITVQEVQA